MSFARYDHIGEGGLLKKANLILKQSLQENGWSFYFIGRLTNKDGPIRGLTQACVYAITKDKKTYIVPLCAKDYTVEFEGAKWFSVSERIIYAAETDVVFTYIAELGYVVATDRKVCREDVAKSEHYLRFLERYYGWKEDQWARMTDFLATESVREPLVNV